MDESTDSSNVLRMRRKLTHLARGFRAAQVLITCSELGVFDALIDGPATAEQIARAIECEPRGVRLLLNAGVALGLLELRDANYFNSAQADLCLTSAAAASMSRSLRLEAAFYSRWSRLAQAVRSGLRPEEDRRDEQDAGWVRRFVYGLYDSARLTAPFIANALALADDRPLRVLDVGGCHGAYSLELARRHPQLTATVFDLPAVEPFATEIVRQSGLADRVSVQAGDFRLGEFTGVFDVALVLGVLNGEPIDGRQELIRKVFRCLRPGGRIVLRDAVLNADRAGPPDEALVALHMLLATEDGGLDTVEDWERWLSEAGFGPLERISLPDWLGSALWNAQKPHQGLPSGGDHPLDPGA